MVVVGAHILMLKRVRLSGLLWSHPFLGWQNHLPVRDVIHYGYTLLGTLVLKWLPVCDTGIDTVILAFLSYHDLLKTACTVCLFTISSIMMSFDEWCPRFQHGFLKRTLTNNILSLSGLEAVFEFTQAKIQRAVCPTSDAVGMVAQIQFWADMI